jgi:signal transduction histidine kinase
MLQVLANLVGNALKYVPAGKAPEVRITAKREENRVRLWVDDNGIGIPSEQQEKIFGIFVRLHSREVYEGTGIGLAIVRRAVERMGGRVGVESEPGKGSRFWVEVQAG